MYAYPLLCGFFLSAAAMRGGNDQGTSSSSSAPSSSGKPLMSVLNLLIGQPNAEHSEDVPPFAFAFTVRFHAVNDPECLCSGALISAGIATTSKECADKLKLLSAEKKKIYATTQIGLDYEVQGSLSLGPDGIGSITEAASATSLIVVKPKSGHVSEIALPDVLAVVIPGSLHRLPHEATTSAEKGPVLVAKWQRTGNNWQVHEESVNFLSKGSTSTVCQLSECATEQFIGVQGDNSNNVCDSGAPLYLHVQTVAPFFVGVRIQQGKYANVYPLKEQIEAKIKQWVENRKIMRKF